jgi:outer membrane protein assembly factor BamE
MTRLLLVLTLIAPLAGCAIYRMDIGQGNIVTQETLDQVRPGMTRSQVRFLLGTPLVSDPFHPDRWDYYYSLRKGRAATPEIRLVTVVFKGDALTSIEGSVTPKRLDDVKP